MVSVNCSSSFTDRSVARIHALPCGLPSYRSTRRLKLKQSASSSEFAAGRCDWLGIDRTAASFDKTEQCFHRGVGQSEGIKLSNEFLEILATRPARTLPGPD